MTTTDRLVASALIIISATTTVAIGSFIVRGITGTPTPASIEVSEPVVTSEADPPTLSGPSDDMLHNLQEVINSRRATAIDDSQRIEVYLAKRSGENVSIEDILWDTEEVNGAQDSAVLIYRVGERRVAIVLIYTEKQWHLTPGMYR